MKAAIDGEKGLNPWVESVQLQRVGAETQRDLLMNSIERELDRVLTLLRNKIREQGFTQLEVQEALGWGRDEEEFVARLRMKPVRTASGVAPVTAS